MKGSIGLVAIMTGLAVANPLAGSVKTERGFITANNYKHLRVALVSCLEANPPAHPLVSDWATSIASGYTTRDELVEAITDCESKQGN